MSSMDLELYSLTGADIGISKARPGSSHIVSCFPARVLPEPPLPTTAGGCQ